MFIGSRHRDTQIVAVEGNRHHRVANADRRTDHFEHGLIDRILIEVDRIHVVGHGQRAGDVHLLGPVRYGIRVSRVDWLFRRCWVAAAIDEPVTIPFSRRSLTMKTLLEYKM